MQNIYEPRRQCKRFHRATLPLASSKQGVFDYTTSTIRFQAQRVLIVTPLSFK